MQDFRELRVWQIAHQITLAVYKVTASFPRDELYGLTGQLRRCSASIAANIAEGRGRGGDTEFGRFCRIAMGSAAELQYHLILARDLKLIKPKEYDALSAQAADVKRMLTGLTSRLKADGGRRRAESG